MQMRLMAGLVLDVCVSVLLFAPGAQTIRGSVVETGTSNKISGAIITRLSDEATAVSDANGDFSFDGSFTRFMPPATNAGVRFDGTDIQITLNGSRPVTITRYYLNGQRESSLFSATLSPGNHRFRPRTDAAGLMITEVQMGETRFVNTALHLRDAACRTTVLHGASLTKRMAATAAAAENDTLHVWADRYLNSYFELPQDPSSCTIELSPLPSSTLEPIASYRLIIQEANGLVAVEAEHFVRQTKTDVRAWYLNAAGYIPAPEPDHDTASAAEAGGKAYMEITPDTFSKEGDPYILGENVAEFGGDLAVMEYPVWFNTTGRYYVWTRTRSNDQEDNTLTGGIDGTWPRSADILQHPTETKTWNWNNKIRYAAGTEDGGDGTTNAIFNITTAGLHKIYFCMREDGQEFDRFFITTDGNYSNPGTDIGPAASSPRTGVLPAAF